MYSGFNICVTDAIFSDVAEILRYGLQSLGHHAVVNRMATVKDFLNIFLGVQLIGDFSQIPPDSIIFNAEQMGSSSTVVNNALYLDVLKRYTVWDYSPKNIEHLDSLGITASLIKIGYAPTLNRVNQKIHQDIDVLFYGSINQRRNRILVGLQERGVRTLGLVGVYGPELDDYLSRSKVVLNIHYYETKIFEIFRLCYLLTNKKAVVSELDETTEIEPDLTDAILGVPYDDLVEECHILVANTKARKALEERSFEIYSARDQSLFLRDAVACLPVQIAYR